jgi:CARDB
LESDSVEDSAASPGRRRRPPRRPERQQIILRRALALGAGLLILILIVLGVKGCLNARKHRALSDYARNVTQIVEETETTSKGFFEKLDDPGELSVTEFVAEVNADRSAMDNYEGRVDGLDAPGDMGHAQEALELTYDLRSSAMTEIAEQISTALGDVGAEKATAAIARQMEKLLASDVIYATVVRPEINRVLADNGIEGDDVPESVFLPDETKWLDEGTVSSALSSISGGGETSGVHGLGMLGTSLNGTQLVAEATTAVSLGEETPEVEVEVQNQGDSTENSVTVSVTEAGGGTVDQTISSIGAGEIQTVAIPLVPAPTGTATLEVEVQPVPGEQVTSNNEAAYTVEFE